MFHMDMGSTLPEKEKLRVAKDKVFFFINGIKRLGQFQNKIGPTQYATLTSKKYRLL